MSLLIGTTVTCAEELDPAPEDTPLLPLRSRDVKLLTGSPPKLVAVTVTLVRAVTEGAVKRPLLEIVPALAFHWTAVLLVVVKVAINCCVAPEEMVAVEGDSPIFTLELLGEDVEADDGETTLQPVERQARTESSTTLTKGLRNLVDAA